MTQQLHDFSEEEYARRLVKMRRAMLAREIDALVVDQFEHLVYLFGNHTGAMAAICSSWMMTRSAIRCDLSHKDR